MTCKAVSVIHRKYLTHVIALILALASLAIGHCAENGVKQEMTAAVEAVRPSLIRILVVSADYRQGREVKMESAGSGVIISADGYAVTNHHVAGNAKRLICTLADKRIADAKLIGTDPLSDIAVIRLTSPDGKPFPTAQFGDSSTVEVGDRVYAMGCPYALSQSVTNGIVSNIEMIMPDLFDSEEFTLEGEDVGSIVRWIGHDAQIEPGNSGGPLVNHQGEIVGINEISVGLSGAIPSNLVKEVATQLIKSGKVVRSWLGLEVQPLLRSSGLDKGILVSGVLSDSPAAKSGFKAGDVLINLGGQPVTAQFKEQVPLFNQYVADLPVGKSVEAIVMRDGKQMSFTITPTEREKATDKQCELKSWGICASNITYMDQMDMQLDSRDGILVTSILPSGPVGSAKPALVEGDIITKVGPAQVKNVSELRAATEKLLGEKTEPTPVIINFDRKLKHYATVITLNKDGEADDGAEINKAWLPIDSQVLTRELAEALGVAGKTGVRITQVYVNSSASKAGLMVGDLIVKLDGESIPAEQVEDDEVLPGLIRQYDVGAEVKLGIVRDGKPRDINVKLESSPKPIRDYASYEDPNFEFTARDIAFSDKSGGNVAEGLAGAFIESVSEGSWTALADLRFGDVVTAVDGKPVTDLASLKAVMTSMAESRPKSIVFRVQRGVHTLFLEVQPEWSESAQ